MRGSDDYLVKLSSMLPEASPAPNAPGSLHEFNVPPTPTLRRSGISIVTALIPTDDDEQILWPLYIATVVITTYVFWRRKFPR